MKNQEINFNFIPLTFFSTKEDILYQIKNTLIMRYIYNKLKDIRELNSLLKKTQYGYTASARDNGRYKLLRITDLKNGYVDWNNVPFCDGECDQYLLRKGDIVIARTGNNKSFLISEVPNNAIFASYLIRLETNDKLLPEYLNIFLNSYLFWNQVIDMQIGTAIPNVNAQKLRTLKIPYCNIEEQREIIKVYSKLNEEKNYQSLVNDLDKINLKINYFFELDNLDNRTEIYISSLRSAILSEAVQGKLVPQDPRDEPASELLKKIKAEKEKLIRDGKIKKQKPLAPIAKDEIPYELPKGWEWVRLGDIILSDIGGGTPSKNKPEYWDGDVPWASVKDLNEDIFLTKTQDKISEIGLKNSSSNLIPKDNLIICTRMGLGKILFNKIDVAINQDLRAVFLSKSMSSFYFYYFYKTLSFIYSGTTVSGIRREKLLDILFPLPPLSEQHRIVAKIDKLMAYCDELEKQVKKNQQNAEKLMEAVLKESFER